MNKQLKLGDFNSMLGNTSRPGAIQTIADEMQRWLDEEGLALRENLGLARPANRFFPD